ncbi:unnamed protein product [marine sediment metagenome]|uniref:Uncharacterized protein n=1 Tax=marine sediment metagenome TaxID=412755 RepID=X1P8E9_9ZZZZ
MPTCQSPTETSGQAVGQHPELARELATLYDAWARRSLKSTVNSPKGVYSPPTAGPEAGQTLGVHALRGAMPRRLTLPSHSRLRFATPGKP